jgi:hypothetical protein
VEQKKTNQERGRKSRRGQAKSLDHNQPSKAPGQDQTIKDVLGAELDRKLTHADADSTEQGISNRPAKEEQAFPPSNDEAETTTTDPTIPQQQGGNRGNV